MTTPPPDEVARVAAGYDVVYEAIPRSPTFGAIWRAHSLGADYPEGFEHISFVTLAELQWMAGEMRLGADATFVDLACGMGGPGLWIARETGANLTGIDISTVAVTKSQERANALGLADQSKFQVGSFAETSLGDGSVDGVMTIDALQYAPDKRAAIGEVARILRPGGRFVFACFALDERRVAGLPVFGDDPVGDYRPVLVQGGFDVTHYEEAPNWRQRLTATYQAIADAGPVLAEEMGVEASAALLGEVGLTLQLQPYSSRVLVAATKV